MNGAHNDHVTAIAAAVLDDIDLKQADVRASVMGHAEAVAVVFLDNAPRLAKLRSTQYGPVIVLLKDAYGGYGEGVTALKQSLDAGYGMSLDASGPLSEGRRALDEVNAQLELLDASGSLICG